MGQEDRNRQAFEKLVKDSMAFAKSIGNNPSEAQVRKEVGEHCNNAQRRKETDGAKKTR